MVQRDALLYGRGLCPGTATVAKSPPFFLRPLGESSDQLSLKWSAPAVGEGCWRRGIQGVFGWGLLSIALRNKHVSSLSPDRQIWILFSLGWLCTPGAYQKLFQFNVSRTCLSIGECVVDVEFVSFGVNVFSRCMKKALVGKYLLSASRRSGPAL